MTIGERLEDARKRKGVSIREAAETTKIRGDFLLAMENNSFDINLPEIYTRGFLKIYANFLKVDVEKVLSDYDTMRLAGRKPSHRHNLPPVPGTSSRRDTTPSTPAAPGGSGNGQPASGEDEKQGPARSSFGRMDLPDMQPDPGEEPQRVPLPDVDDGDNESDRALYLKIAAAGGGLIVLILLVILVISLFSGGDDKPEINPGLAQNNTTQTQPAAQPAESGALDLIASAPVTVIAIQRSNGERVFQGTLAPGERRTVQATGPVELRYTDGSALVIERGGRRLAMDTQGIGKSVIQ